MLHSNVVPYRDDRQALALQVAELERENERLRREIHRLENEGKKMRDAERQEKRASALQFCALCGGSLHAVALFAGREARAPIPLSVSTTRFGDPQGGFTRSAPLKSRVCSSCGFVHNFIDFGTPEAAEVTGSFMRADAIEGELEDSSDDDDDE